jgi:hypothetical protein
MLTIFDFYFIDLLRFLFSFAKLYFWQETNRMFPAIFYCFDLSLITLALGGRRVSEHSPRNPKGKGSSPGTTTAQ